VDDTTPLGVEMAASSATSLQGCSSRVVVTFSYAPSVVTVVLPSTIVTGSQSASLPLIQKARPMGTPPSLCVPAASRER
jgi:hypothetical protein